MILLRLKKIKMGETTKEKIVLTDWLYFIPQQLNDLVDVLKFDDVNVLYYHVKSDDNEIYLCIEESMEQKVRKDIITRVQKMRDDEEKKQFVALKVRGIPQPGHEVEMVAVTEYVVEILDAEQ
jgi:hypothetical protein